MKAVNMYVVIKPIKEKENKVKGLILTEDTDDGNRYAKGEVISIGEEVKGIKEGDIIHYDKHAGHTIIHEEEFLQVIRQRDIVLID